MRYYTTLWNWVLKVSPNFQYSVTIFYVKSDKLNKKLYDICHKKMIIFNYYTLCEVQI